MTVEVSRALEPFREMREAVAPYEDKARFNLLLPTTFIGVSPLFVPMPTVVQVNPEDSREVYDTPGSGGSTVCLHSTTLERIANAGGLDFDPSLERHDHNLATDPLVCRFSVGGWYIDSIGQRRLVGDGVTHDLSDTSPRVKLLGGPNAKPVQVARQFICEQARSRARNRVIRKCMNLASSYRKDELRKPFVAFRFRLNEADEDVKRALIARAVGASSEVFGERRALPAPNPHDAGEDIEGQIIETEPEIPDEKVAPQKVDIRAAIGRLQVRPSDDGSAVGDPAGVVAYALRDALGLKAYDKADLGIVRRKIVGTVFGTPVADLTAGAVTALTSAASSAQGKQDLVSLFEHLASVDEDMKRIRQAQA